MASIQARPRPRARRDYWTAIIHGWLPPRDGRKGDDRPLADRIEAVARALLGNDMILAIPVAKRPRVVWVEIHDDSSTRLGTGEDYRAVLAPALIRARLVLPEFSGPDHVRIVTRGRFVPPPFLRTHADRKKCDGRLMTRVAVWEPPPGWAG